MKDARKIELYLHGEDVAVAKLVEVDEDMSIRELVQKGFDPGTPGAGNIAEIFVFIEDDETPRNHDHKIGPSGIKHHHHVHCHRCREVAVVVTYDGKVHEHKFAPNTKVERVFHWAIEKFKLSGDSVHGLVLESASGPKHELEMDAHIGRYVKFPECRLSLILKHAGHHHHEVEITINGPKYWTHRGVNSVEHLRQLGKVPADEILSEYKNGQYIDLDNRGNVEICGGEVFASHIPSSGSS